MESTSARIRGPGSPPTYGASPPPSSNAWNELSERVTPFRPYKPPVIPGPGFGVVHGWVFFTYLLATLNLSVKVRWPIVKTFGILLSGTIPLLGIIVEHFQTRDIKARFGL